MRPVADRRALLWTYATRGILWRVEAGAQDYLVGEDRSPEAKAVSYFCLERRTGKPRWEGMVPPGGWWSGIEAAAGGIVLLHGFATPDMPLHRGLSAVECRTGRVLWSLPQGRFLRLEGRAVVVMEEGKGPLHLDAETGTAIGEEGEHARPSMEIRWPEPFWEEGVDRGLRAALQAVVPEPALRESLLAVRGEGYCALSYSEPAMEGTPEEPRFRTTLTVLAGPPWEPRYTEIVHRAVRAVLPEPFFCQDGVLYFVKDRSVLVAVSLRAHEPMVGGSA